MKEKSAIPFARRKSPALTSLIAPASISFPVDRWLPGKIENPRHPFLHTLPWARPSASRPALRAALRSLIAPLFTLSRRPPRAAWRFPIAIGNRLPRARYSVRGSADFRTQLGGTHRHPRRFHARCRSLCCAAKNAAQQMPPATGVGIEHDGDSHRLVLAFALSPLSCARRARGDYQGGFASPRITHSQTYEQDQKPSTVVFNMITRSDSYLCQAITFYAIFFEGIIIIHKIPPINKISPLTKTTLEGFIA